MLYAPRLLCIDLQPDEARGLTADAHAVFGARQLLSIARRCGWSVIHTRLRPDVALHGDAPASTISGRTGGLRPLTTERVFLRERRPIVDCPQLMDQLERWSRDTVYVAAFDPLALLSLLIDRLDRGPRFVLVEEAIAAEGASQVSDPFRLAACSLASTTSVRLLAEDFGHLPAGRPSASGTAHH